jgi:hypothetical protein
MLVGSPELPSHLLAVVTRIVGATLGANVILIVPDISRVRPVPDCVAADAKDS